MIKNFPASLSKLYEMLQFIDEQAKAIGFDEGQTSKIELAIEEALVNIISYAYPGCTGMIEIECHESESSGLAVILKDNGIPYNSLALYNSLDPKTPLEIRSIGGRGMHLICGIMDKVDYRRKENRNILTLIKYRS